MTELQILPPNSPAAAVPRYATIFVNWVCNLRCRECWLYGDSSGENTWLKEVKKDRMSLDMWNHIIDELAGAWNAPVISIMGGEPLIHPQIAEMVSAAKRRVPACELDVSTNGTLLPRVADALVEGGIDTVYVSLDGPTPEINDPIRGNGSCDRALAGLAALQEATRRAGHGPLIALNFTLTGMNYTTLPDLARLAERVGVCQVTVDLSMYFTRAEGTASQPTFEAITGRPFLSWMGYCNEHQHASIEPGRLREVLDEAMSCSAAVEVLVAPVRYTSREKSLYFTDEWPTVVHERTCPKLWAQTTILPNGDVISCTPFSDTVMGSVAQSSLSEVWLGETYRRMRGTIREQLQPVCYRCCELSLDIGVDPALYSTAPPRSAT